MIRCHDFHKIKYWHNSRVKVFQNNYKLSIKDNINFKKEQDLVNDKQIPNKTYKNIVKLIASSFKTIEFG